MKKKSKQQTKPSQDVHISPELDAAIAAWETALQAFQNEAGKEERDAYMKATDELGQAISAWAAEQPEVADEFATWFDAKEHWARQRRFLSLKPCDRILLDTCQRPPVSAQLKK